MTTKTVARGSAKRTENMNKRREQILSCAGSIIASKGIEALTLPKLAEEAEVTIPTIHNLIGKKSDIFKRLVEIMVSKVEHALSQQNANEPIVAAETFVDKLLELFASNEDFYKAAFVAGESSQLFEHKLPTGIFAKSLQLTINLCLHAKEQGHLEGKIDTIQLAHELFGCQRLARYDWMHGYIDLKTYRKQVLAGMYILFASDASPNYRVQLLNKLNALNS